jgi:hypothetical protein
MSAQQQTMQTCYLNIKIYINAKAPNSAIINYRFRNSAWVILFQDQ